MIIKFNIILIPMRSLTTALGCLVIAAYATIGQATENHDMGSNLIAKCHFGHNGYVIFRQRPDDRDHIRANQYDRKKIGGTKKGKKKLMMMQQVAAAGAGLQAAAIGCAVWFEALSSQAVGVCDEGTGRPIRAALGVAVLFVAAELLRGRDDDRRA